ncbi:MAG: TIGR01777 family protein [Rhodothermaceae bacterium]|nr:TIGR01777 family protein [Rhodothermaceae bacterium]
MSRFVRRTPIATSADNLFAWHAQPGAFQRLTPPWSGVRLESFEGIGEGERAVIRLSPGVRWIAEHHVLPEAERRAGILGFQDVQVTGPFAAWTHHHRFLPDGPGRSILEDDITYRLPLAPVSKIVAGTFARRQLARMFAYRHRVTQGDVGRHTATALEPLTVALTGASGLLGKALSAFLLTGGHRVVRLVRSRQAVTTWNRSEAEQALYWNVEQGEVDEVGLATSAPDAVIHLAGEPVYALRWTNEKKRRIWESRTKGTQLLSRALARLDRPPRVLLSASGSGYYGDRGADRITEGEPPGAGFLAEVCQAWEASTQEAEDAGIRTVHLRLGPVLSPAGGLLDTLLPLFKLGLGGHVGRGDQFLPWVALDDVLYAVLHLLAGDLDGPVNLSAPTPVTMRRFAKALEPVLWRPARLRAPQSLLTFLSGDLARETVLASSRLLPQRLVDDGFTFAYPALDTALRHLLGATTEGSPDLPALP